LPESADKRINILNQKEVEELYGFPRFSDEERMTFFVLTPPEQLVDWDRLEKSIWLNVLSRQWTASDQHQTDGGASLSQIHP
jgi:hypothetical protein